MTSPPAPLSASRHPARTGRGERLIVVAATVLRTPVTARAGRELLFCAIAFCLTYVGLPLIVVAMVLVLPAAASGRKLGAIHRRLAAWLLGERLQPSGSGWRAIGYLFAKLPVTAVELYACALAATGAVNVSFPFWWGFFRNHSPGTHLRPVFAFTPIGAIPVTTFPGAVAALAAGVAMLLLAPWIARAAVAADRRLMRILLGPGRLAILAQTRTLAVEESAALLRRVERDLHDGAQVRLATLALNLGLAKEHLDSLSAGAGDASQGVEPGDLTPVRELIDTARQGAKEALRDLRDLARGIHPPVLDNGLPDALASLAAASPIPVRLAITLPARPTPAIESIAYFCAAELLANAVKHSSASEITIELTGHRSGLRLAVADDGTGGADTARGTGLTGLIQRVSTVDGRLEIISPPGRPTQVVVELPLRA